MINSTRISGSTSLALRKALFLSFVLPLFTWLFPLFPLFTDKQQQDLSHFYYTCLKRVMFCQHWNDQFFFFISNEISLEDRCRKYWDKYLIALADSTDGELLLEQANLNMYREAWISKEYKIQRLFLSKRFVRHTSLLERIIRWSSNTPSNESIPNYELDDILVLAEFPDTF